MLAVAWAGLPSVGQAGWITAHERDLGNPRPAGASKFRFGSPTALPLVAIDGLTGAGAVQAVAGGGTSFFNGLGVPVLLNLSDGSAYLAGGSQPTRRASRVPGCTPPGHPVPQTGVPVPDGYSRLGVALVPGTAGCGF
ncbi:hypothetical protein C1280_17115 [Gemmata obscuriglobus]|uniref:Uncharacterized protein n=1 Tax=Gemmata obscuriglobus TaxID=114 RepID=A0A2Z3H2I2_9BACT|nr:hypothetical protein C1280_17115 [Gemmata obscuriglobus]